jgi:hypothetical protein
MAASSAHECSVPPIGYGFNGPGPRNEVFVMQTLDLSKVGAFANTVGKFCRQRRTGVVNGLGNRRIQRRLQSTRAIFSFSNPLAALAPSRAGSGHKFAASSCNGRTILRGTNGWITFFSPVSATLNPHPADSEQQKGPATGALNDVRRVQFGDRRISTPCDPWFRRFYLPEFPAHFNPPFAGSSQRTANQRQRRRATQRLGQHQQGRQTSMVCIWQDSAFPPLVPALLNPSLRAVDRTEL